MRYKVWRAAELNDLQEGKPLSDVNDKYIVPISRSSLFSVGKNT